MCAQYIQFCEEKQYELQNYEGDHEGLGITFVHLMKHDPSCSMLWGVLEVLLLLSHGQASVERGLTANKQIAVNNKRLPTQLILLLDSFVAKLCHSIFMFLCGLSMAV